MLTISERLIIKRYLKPKRKEGLLKIISLFSFLGISLGVATLIVVMAVMNGFRDELISKLLSFQPHITIEKIKNDQKTFNSVKNELLKQKFDISSISLVQNGKGLILTDKISKGIVFKGFDKEYGNFNQVFKMKYYNLSLRQLKTILVVSEQKRLIKASDLLSLTPPAVTIQLRQAEEEIGLILFDRTPEGLKLTDAGIEVVKCAKKIFGELNDGDDFTSCPKVSINFFTF